MLLDGVLALSNFLAYATTALVGRNHAAGRVALASTLARQAMWLAALLGMSVVALGLTLGAPMLDLLGGGGAVPDAAYSYLRLAVFGLPFALIALAGQGYLRGTGDLKTPLLFIAAGNLLNVALDVLFIIVLGMGTARFRSGHRDCPGYNGRRFHTETGEGHRRRGPAGAWPP